MSDWQPIETAPKDGRVILIAFGSMGVWAVSWRDGPDDFPMWCVDDNKRGPYYLRGISDIGNTAPTHWMPLPAPPNTDSKPALASPPADTDAYAGSRFDTDAPICGNGG